MSSSEGSITRCIAMLKRGDQDAAQVLWRRYSGRLVALARARLRRAEAGRFARLEGRDDLWQLLVVLTVRKAANLAKHERRLSRGGGHVALLSDLEGQDLKA